MAGGAPRRAGPAAETPAAFAQIVYTATDTLAVTAVRFTLDGQTIPVSIERGTLVTVPVTRLTYAGMAPRP